MDRIRAWTTGQTYTALNTHADTDTDADEPNDGVIPPAPAPGGTSPFSWTEYCIFVLVGASMLWAWNMFLAAGPYLQQRFASSAWIAANFQAVELSVSNVANLGAMLLLTRLRPRAVSYPARIFLGLALNSLVFALLALSTAVDAGAEAYFGFVVATVLCAAVATALFQNAIFAYVAGFAQPRYTQGIMVGQGVAGVLPCIAQIALVLGLRRRDDDDDVGGARDPADGVPGSVPPAAPPAVPASAALAYFLTAVAVSLLTVAAFSLLVRRHAGSALAKAHRQRQGPSAAVPVATLLPKLRYPAAAVFLTFVITMLFPVYTQRILSVSADRSPILRPESFIPLAFLAWNAGDLLGRVATAIPRSSLATRPRVLLLLAAARVVFVPLYELCNVAGRGAVVRSDAFYLLVVQVGMGASNGYVGSQCMMGTGEWVEPEEREAAGALMGLWLVLGLAVGSLLSFFVGGG